MGEGSLDTRKTGNKDARKAGPSLTTGTHTTTGGGGGRGGGHGGATPSATDTSNAAKRARAAEVHNLSERVSGEGRGGKEGRDEVGCRRWLPRRVIGGDAHALVDGC